MDFAQSHAFPVKLRLAQMCNFWRHVLSPNEVSSLVAFEAGRRDLVYQTTACGWAWYRPERRLF